MNDPQQPDVRTRILDAAFMLLTEKGVAELTQPRVAKAAGVRTSHLTYYFPTRNDLLIEVARHTINTMVAELKEGLAAAPVKASGLAQVLEAAVTRHRIARIMLSLIVASEEDRAIKKSLNELIANERQHLKSVTASAGIALPEQMIPIWHATLVGAAVLNLARADAASEQEARTISRFVVSAMATRAKSPRAKRSTRSK